MEKNFLDYIDTELLIIGSGIAGLTAAIFGAKAGFKVLVINRAPQLEESNTLYAQGGIVYQGINDSPKILAQDIYLAGDEMGNLKNIYVLAREGPKLVKNFLIDELEVPFSTESSGNLHFTEEAAHSRNRILHVSDFTGKAIQFSLIENLKRYPNIKVLTNHTAIDLITPAHHSRRPQAVYAPLEVIGAYVLDRDLQKVKTILAQRTILATGGLGRIFLYTTNPEGARGDGIAMAARSGARIINLEYIQFHPTCFYHKEGERFLISESVRGEGAVLLNKFKKPFTNSLAPRDEVSRAIYQEMLETKSDFVFLDLSPIKKKGIKLRERFPTIYEKCLKCRIDVEQDLIPVVPASHYSCGGIWTDSWGRSSLKNLYAIGEVACAGVHGANRLASTSLLEGMVFGVRCIKDINRHYQKKNLEQFEIPAWIEGREEVDQALVLQDWSQIRTIMWNYAGIIRSSKRLMRANEDLRHLDRQIEEFYQQTRLNDDLIGLHKGIKVARLVVDAAQKNKQSRGCHYRVD